MLLVDGAPSEHLPADDRGLQFGDGLFETIAVVAGYPRLLDEHLQRLANGASVLTLPPPDQDCIAREVMTLAARTEGCGIIKVVWTAGSGGRGYGRPDTVKPRRIISVHPAPAHPDRYWDVGVDVALVAVSLAPQPALAGIKHLNRLEQVLARAEWQGTQAAEGLMQSQDGLFIEGTMSNLFLVHRGRVATPQLDQCGIAGVMRQAVMANLAAQNMGVDEIPVDASVLCSADEVFVCNSVNGIWPVREINTLGNWPVGPVTRVLQQWIDQAGLACTPACRHKRG